MEKVLEQVKDMIAQKKNATRGYTHAEIFEVLTRGLENIEFDLLLQEKGK